MAKVKLTKVAKFNAIANMVSADATFEDGSSVVEFLTHEAEMIDKRNKRKTIKVSPKSIENIPIAEKIVSLLGESGRMTATEIAKELDLSSPQKVVGVVKNYAENTITKEKEKGKTYYILK